MSIPSRYKTQAKNMLKNIGVDRKEELVKLVAGLLWNAAQQDVRIDTLKSTLVSIKERMEILQTLHKNILDDGK